VKRYLRFCFGLKGYFANKISLKDCEGAIRARMEKRETLFLNLMKKGVCDYGKSPYQKLLKIAHCEFKDLESMVKREGIEKTLESLRREGVYLTYDEFKGKKEVKRGGKSYQFEERDFDNPFLQHYYEVQSGGYKKAGTRAMIDLDFLSSKATYESIILNTHGVYNSPLILYLPILPGSSGINSLLRYTKIGNTPLKWFTMIDSTTIQQSLKQKLMTYTILFAGSFFGGRLPKPEVINLNSLWGFIHFLSKILNGNPTCSIYTYPSSAVRICMASKKEGLNLNGVKFFVVGEPLTRMKCEEIEATGAKVIPKYHFAEAGCIGCGCNQPETFDDIHLFKDTTAVIQHQRRLDKADFDVDPLLFTSLLPSSPKILLNVESGDLGILRSRHCGCQFDELGFIDHLYHIRSFEKLTSEGMTLLSQDLYRIVEEILPHKFGGNSTDYQILEEEDSLGFTRLTVLVSPSVGRVDEVRLLETIHGELRNGRSNRNLISEMWSQANTLQVRRSFPLATGRGKIFPLHKE
jgi:hypothetical protein